MTVFSAPDYPQFQLPGERYDNLGAVLRLSPPDYTEPAALQFSASLPRPEVQNCRRSGSFSPSTVLDFV